MVLGLQIDLDKLLTRSQLVIQPIEGELSLRPQDVGIGISQVVPVLVTALADKGNLVAIEQPELHLHPKLQAELGDLFIETAKGERKHMVILETHSELIPLRLMRRIRETNDGNLPGHVPGIDGPGPNNQTNNDMFGTPLGNYGNAPTFNILIDELGSNSADVLQLNGLTITVAAIQVVPEPSSIALCIIGVALIGVAVYRGRRKQ